MSDLTERKLSQEQLDALQSEDEYLRGSCALQIVNDAVKATGVQVPASYIFRDRQNTAVNKALHASFELLGGVPGMLAWAMRDDKHLSQFYSMYAKQAAPDVALTTNGNITIHTTVPESPLDATTIDVTGRVVRDTE